MKRTVVYGGHDIVAISESAAGGWGWSYTIDGRHQSVGLGQAQPDQTAALDDAVDRALDKIDTWGGGPAHREHF